MLACCHSVGGLLRSMRSTPQPGGRATAKQGPLRRSGHLVRQDGERTGLHPTSREWKPLAPRGEEPVPVVDCLLPATKFNLLGASDLQRLERKLQGTK